MMAAASRSSTAAWPLSRLLADLIPVPAAQDVNISGIAIDSRRVRPGDLFLACSGQQVRGHDYIPAAIAAGAVAVVYDQSGEESVAACRAHHPHLPMLGLAHLTQQIGVIAARYYGEPSQQLRVIGVTGTNGKTSCTQFLAQALSRPQHACGIIGTLGNGLYGALVTGAHTTPDALTLQSLLAEMRAQGAEHVVMEVSSHGLDQGRVNGVRFTTAVFTNLTRDHLDYHGDMRAYGEAKRRLFHLPHLAHAVINVDDAFGREIYASVPAGVRPVSYSLHATQQRPGGLFVQGRLTQLDQRGLSLAVHSSWGEGVVHSKLRGSFNAYNLLAVMATLLVNDVAWHDVLAAMSQLQPVPGRMECFGGGDLPLVIIDYAHTPDALQHVLQAAREYTQGALWCVFGCGGDRDRGKRPLMGEIVEQHADLVVITDDNPRTENPENIVADILIGMQAPKLAYVQRDRAQAIAHAIKQAAAGDVVVVAGKGHEDYQIIGRQKLAFSDSAVVHECLGVKL